MYGEKGYIIGMCRHSGNFYVGMWKSQEAAKHQIEGSHVVSAESSVSAQEPEELSEAEPELPQDDEENNRGSGTDTGMALRNRTGNRTLRSRR